jgi:hypothetical protein
MDQYEKEEYITQRNELSLVLRTKYSVEESGLIELAKTVEDKDLHIWLALTHIR